MQVGHRNIGACVTKTSAVRDACVRLAVRLSGGEQSQCRPTPAAAELFAHVKRTALAVSVLKYPRLTASHRMRTYARPSFASLPDLFTLLHPIAAGHLGAASLSPRKRRLSLPGVSNDQAGKGNPAGAAAQQQLVDAQAGTPCDITAGGSSSSVSAAAANGSQSGLKPAADSPAAASTHGASRHAAQPTSATPEATVPQRAGASSAGDGNHTGSAGAVAQLPEDRFARVPLQTSPKQSNYSKSMAACTSAAANDVSHGSQDNTAAAAGTSLQAISGAKVSTQHGPEAGPDAAVQPTVARTDKPTSSVEGIKAAAPAGMLQKTPCKPADGFVQASVTQSSRVGTRPDRVDSGNQAAKHTCGSQAPPTKQSVASALQPSHDATAGAGNAASSAAGAGPSKAAAAAAPGSNNGDATLAQPSMQREQEDASNNEAHLDHEAVQHTQSAADGQDVGLTGPNDVLGGGQPDNAQNSQDVEDGDIAEVQHRGVWVKRCATGYVQANSYIAVAGSLVISFFSVLISLRRQAVAVCLVAGEPGPERKRQANVLMKCMHSAQSCEPLVNSCN